MSFKSSSLITCFSDVNLLSNVWLTAVFKTLNIILTHDFWKKSQGLRLVDIVTWKWCQEQKYACAKNKNGHDWMPLQGCPVQFDVVGCEFSWICNNGWAVYSRDPPGLLRIPTSSGIFFRQIKFSNSCRLPSYQSRMWVKAWYVCGSAGNGTRTIGFLDPISYGAMLYWALMQGGV